MNNYIITNSPLAIRPISKVYVSKKGLRFIYGDMGIEPFENMELDHRIVNTDITSILYCVLTTYEKKQKFIKKYLNMFRY